MATLLATQSQQRDKNRFRLGGSDETIPSISETEGRCLINNYKRIHSKICADEKINGL